MAHGPQEIEDAHGPRLTRRRALAAGAATAAAATLPLNGAALARERRKPIARDGSFEWGVSAGFPLPRGIVLWTRVGELERSSKLMLEVATDRGFDRIVHRQRVTAKRSRDFTVHTKVGKLKPRTEYFYRFHTRNSESRVGRFRTAPPHDSDEQIRIGFFSCQSWQAGYFTAHGALADEDDLDLVLCLGDYIYEDGTYDGGPRIDNTGTNGDGDCQTLDEFRQKYRLYQSDPQLQAMHAAHPFVAIWDDHEVEDNYAGNQPSSAAEEGKTNSGEPRRVPIAQRQANGYKTFFDSMPRLRRKGDPSRIYGRARLGKMADLFMLDQRQYRDPQPCGDAFFTPCPESNTPGRAYLGRTQMDWAKRSLERSGARWRLLGNQLMVMAFDVAPGQPVLVDSWEGYGAERTELMSHIVERDIGNVVAMTGDIHTFFAGRMTTTGRIDGTPAGVELVGGSVTSLGVKETLGGLPVENFEAAIRANNPHMIYADFDRRGYGVLSLNRKDAICEYKSPETALEPGAEVSRLASFRIPAGSRSVEQID